MNGFSFAAIILSGLAIGWVIGATTVVRKDAPVDVSRGEVVGKMDGVSIYRLYDPEDGAANPRVFMYMEVADEFFIVDIFGGPVGAVYFSGDVDCGFYPVTIKAASIEVHRFGPPA